MKRFNILIFCILFFSPDLWGRQDSLRQILKELDDVIAQKGVYHAEKENRIRSLEKHLERSSDIMQQYELYGSLVEEFLHYQADSSLYYIEKEREASIILGHKSPNPKIIINRAEAMGVIGMYHEALAELKQLNTSELDNDDLRNYYYTARACYGWLADNTLEKDIKWEYMRNTDLYRDSILNIPHNVGESEVIEAERLVLLGQPDRAIALLAKYLDNINDLKQLSYINYTISEAYSAKNDIEKEMYYLARTAICDIKRSVREYASLQKLARLVYKQGDIERAYQYLTCSMEDAVACNAHLRFMEVTEFYPIINKAYKAKADNERYTARIMFISVSTLTVLLIITIFYLGVWMKKLSAMRKHLHEINRQLVSTNHQLEQTGKIKEAYIAHYLERCVGYLEKLERYRRSLEKLAMASNIDELFKNIRSDQFLRDERKAFYMEFDKVFLDLFPNFVEDFNRLLVDEAHIIPKSGELLNTELRIFALIRLGITDATSIAHFLGYSLATVYNYRSKIRNKVIGNKENFEQEVMQL